MTSGYPTTNDRLCGTKPGYVVRVEGLIPLFLSAPHYFHRFYVPACQNANGNKPRTPKYKVTFSVNEVFTAKTNKTEIKTDTTVEKDKTVTITLKPDDGFKVMG